MGIHWLASYPKSGNTWVRAFLSAYRFGKVDINRLGFVSSDNHQHLFQMCSPEPFHEVDTYGWACVRLAMLNAIVVTDHSDPLILKTHNCAASVGDVPVIPEGLSEPSIYLVRDPRDVAVSYANHLQKPIDQVIDMMCKGDAGVAHNAKRGGLMEVHASWGLHVKSWQTRQFAKVIRYEDLIEDPDANFKTILEQYGIEYDETKFEHALSASSFSALQKAEDESGFHEKGVRQSRFFRRGEAGCWRDEMTPDQARRIEREFRKAMLAFGYVDRLQVASV